MQVIKENQAFDAPRREIERFFLRGDLFFCSDIHLSFVCGAGEDVQSSLRDQFIGYISEFNKNRIVPIKAEVASSELLRQIEERRKSRGLAIFEKTIADTADSVVIFPESAGSIAELGFFAAHEDTSSKTLVAAHIEHQDPSFINLGPIRNISATSEYAPLPIYVGEDRNAAFEQILERLLPSSDRSRPYRTRFENCEFKEYSLRHQLSILDEIISLVGIVTEPDLADILRLCFRKYDISNVRLLLSVLCATGRVVRNENGDLICVQKAQEQKFIECDSDAPVRVRAAWHEAYRLHLAEAVDEIMGVNRE